MTLEPKGDDDMLPNFNEVDLNLSRKEANKARRKRRKIAMKDLKLCNHSSKRPVTRGRDGLFILEVKACRGGDGD